MFGDKASQATQKWVKHDDTYPMVVAQSQKTRGLALGVADPLTFTHGRHHLELKKLKLSADDLKFFKVLKG